MKYACLFKLIPKEYENNFWGKSKSTMQDAANALQWHIYNGLGTNIKDEVKIFNVLPVGSFPQYYSIPFIPNFTFETPFCKSNENIGFCNVKFFRDFHQTHCIYHALNTWCCQNSGEKTLFVYTIGAPFMKAIAKIKRKFPNLKVCAIVADLPNMDSLSSKSSTIQRTFQHYQSLKSYELIDSVEHFVLLTKQMAEYMKIKQPFCVMEGISSSKNIITNIAEDGIKRIVYTGTLHRKFGILNLIKAFQQIEDNSYRLVICGIGDCEQEIYKAAVEDHRILYMGQVSRDEALKWQQKATVLVNPRQNIQEYTKYSFPSKTMEYLASGVPVVAYKLDGMPDEYDDYLFYAKNDSVSALRDILIMICENEDGSVKRKAEQARQFVLEQKNEIVQTKKILDLIR